MYDKRIVELRGKYSLIDIVNKIVIEKNDFSKGKYFIPAIIPPLKMKPILSKEFIDIWYKSSKMIKEAEKIIIVGYSFNPVDDHFNDLIRKDKSKKNKITIIVDPKPQTILLRIDKIYGYKKEDFVQKEFNGKKVYVKDNLTIIEAGATDVDIDELFKTFNLPQA